MALVVTVLQEEAIEEVAEDSVDVAVDSVDAAATVEAVVAEEAAVAEAVVVVAVVVSVPEPRSLLSLIRDLEACSYRGAKTICF